MISLQITTKNEQYTDMIASPLNTLQWLKMTLKDFGSLYKSRNIYLECSKLEKEIAKKLLLNYTGGLKWSE